MPTIVGDVDAVHQQARVVERLEDGAPLVDLDLPSVDRELRHQSSKLPVNGHLPCRTCSTKSSRKWRTNPWMGHAAASANAQIVFASILPATSTSTSMSSSSPAPRSIRSTILFIHPVPSRHWVHWPHDSSRK